MADKLRDRIKHGSTQYVVACYSRGRIFSEHMLLEDATESIEDHPCLFKDDYAIYTRQEWARGIAE